MRGAERLVSCFWGRCVIAVAAGAALAATAAATAAGGGAAPPDLPVMRPPDLELRAMLLLVAERRVYEPLTVLEALKAGPDLRADLASALGRIPGQEAGSVLAGLLIDDQAEVRRAAAFSLGLRTLISRLQPRVFDERRGEAASQACGRAIVVLATVGAPALRPPLHQTLVDRLAGTVVVEDRPAQ